MTTTSEVRLHQVADTLITFVRRQYGLSEDVAIALQENPRPEVLERMMAFRTDEWYEEFRSALERLSNGTYGCCTVCSGRIEHEQLQQYPMARICRHCLRTLDIQECY